MCCPAPHTAPLSAKQSTLEELPTALTLPTGHARQLDTLPCPVFGWYVFAGQAVQLEFAHPDWFMKLPAAQAWHTDWPTNGLLVPEISSKGQNL